MCPDQPNRPQSATDPISQFWSDMMSRMGSGSASAVPTNPFQPPPDFQEEMAKQMRRAFFDSWAKSCEEAMGSEPFLTAMKQSMDGALDFRKQVNEFLTQTLHDHQMPATSDTDSILQALGHMEDNLLEELADLKARVMQLEEGVRSGSPSSKTSRPKGGSK